MLKEGLWKSMQVVCEKMPLCKGLDGATFGDGHPAIQMCENVIGKDEARFCVCES
jgi:hypothetical protein